MGKAVFLVMLSAMAALAAGEFATGGSELLRFRGSGIFRWDFYGVEGSNPENSMSSCVIADWLPRLNGNVDGQFSLELYSSSGAIKLTDLFLNLHLTENLTLRAGQFKVPFGYANTLSSATMPFSYRAAVLGRPEFMAYGGRDIGVCLTAGMDLVSLDLALTNGTGDNQTADTTVSKQFTARVASGPADWLSLGVSVALIGQPEQPVGEFTMESWNSLGLDLFAVADYPVGETVSIHFAGEYMNLGYAGPGIQNHELAHGKAMLFTLAADFETGSGFVQAVRPAVRYEVFSPMAYYQPGNRPEDDRTALDFCVNLEVFSSANTLQIGGRNYSYENPNISGYTDIYAGWRMNF